MHTAPANHSVQACRCVWRQLLTIRVELWQLLCAIRATPPDAKAAAHLCPLLEACLRTVSCVLPVLMFACGFALTGADCG